MSPSLKRVSGSCCLTSRGRRLPTRCMPLIETLDFGPRLSIRGFRSLGAFPRYAPLLRVPGPFRTRRSEFRDCRGARCPAMAEPRGSGQGAVRPPCPPITGFRTWMSGSWPTYSAQEASAGLRHPLRRPGICKQQPDAVVAPALTPRAAADVAERLARSDRSTLSRPLLRASDSGRCGGRPDRVRSVRIPC